MAKQNLAKLAAMKRALAKSRDKGPEREEPGEVEPRGSTPAIEAAEERRERPS